MHTRHVSKTYTWDIQGINTYDNETIMPEKQQPPRLVDFIKNAREHHIYKRNRNTHQGTRDQKGAAKQQYHWTGVPKAYKAHTETSRNQGVYEKPEHHTYKKNIIEDQIPIEQQQPKWRRNSNHPFVEDTYKFGVHT